MNLKSKLKYFLYLILCLNIISCSSNNESPNSNKAESVSTVYDLVYPLPKLLVSGHRGIKNHSTLPENCLETFQELRKQGDLIIECDINMSKDSVLLLMHDNTVDRTTTGNGRVVDLLWSDLDNLYLKSKKTTTVYTIPSFEEVLEWAVASKTILSVDVKRSVPIERIIEIIRAKDAEPYCMLISYTLGQAKSVYKLAPELMQSVSIRNLEEHHRWKLSGIPAERTIAFTGTRRSSSDLYDQLHKDNVACIFGTLGNIDAQASRQGDAVYKEFIDVGVDIFATDRPLVVMDYLEKNEIR